MARRHRRRLERLEPHTVELVKSRRGADPQHSVCGLCEDLDAARSAISDGPYRVIELADRGRGTLGLRRKPSGRDERAHE